MDSSHPTPNKLRLAFNHFIKTTVRTLLDYKPSVIESKIISHIEYLKDVQKLSYWTIQVHCSAILHFFGMNDVNLNARKIKRFLPQDESDHYSNDRPYYVNEIQQILSKCDIRSRVIVLLMVSTGMFTLEGSATPTYLNARNETPRILLFKHVVTTNYDLVLERYNKDRINPSKHFLRRGLTRGGYCWDEPYLNLDDAEFDLSKIEYLKLHGSIDWWVRLRDNNVVSRESPISLFGETYLKRQMIYPVYDKHISA